PGLSQESATLSVEGDSLAPATGAARPLAPLASGLPSTCIQVAPAADGPINVAAIGSLTGGAQRPAVDVDAVFSAGLDTQLGGTWGIDRLRSAAGPDDAPEDLGDVLFDEALLALLGDDSR